ncbi:hypothetical protein BgiMline_014602 [Biomphalaria glabrata]
MILSFEAVVKFSGATKIDELIGQCAGGSNNVSEMEGIKGIDNIRKMDKEPDTKEKAIKPKERVPYLQLIKGTIAPGSSSILIEGKISSTCKSFFVRLQCDQNIDKSDFPVMFEFIFDKDEKQELTSVVSKSKGQKSDAMDFNQKEFPFSHNNEFKLEIKITESNSCTVIVDDNVYMSCDTTNGLTKDLGLEKSKWLYIDGRIELNKVYTH